MKTRTARLAMAIVTALVAAILLMLQSASSVTSRSAPDQAVTLNPLNGMAAEQAVYRDFAEASEDPDDIANAAAQFRNGALSAYGREPLTPKSLTILALAETDPDKRSAIFDIATRLNRRDPALQLAALDHRLKQRDADAVIATLDQLLRVRPEYADRLFPPLQQALLDPRTESTFAALLDGSSPWHQRFAMFAVRDEQARLRLAAIHDDIVVDDPAFDRQLIAGLAAQGEIGLAREVYGRADKARDTRRRK